MVMAIVLMFAILLLLESSANSPLRSLQIGLVLPLIMLIKPFVTVIVALMIPIVN